MIQLKSGVQIPEGAVVLHTTAALDSLYFSQPLRLVQYDQTTPIVSVTLTYKGTPYTPGEGAELRVRMGKPDGKGVYNPCLGVDDSGLVYFVVTPQMTAAEGTGKVSIEMAENGGVKNSAPVPVHIDPNPVQEGQIQSTDEYASVVEILSRVQALEKTATAAATSADADKTAAQAAREGAEAAEGRVQAIVAGNEAYTKQETHDRFALALQGTADPAASITIYPDAGSNVAATAHGFTIQEGEGDPTPPTVEAQDFAFSRVTGSASSMAVSYIITEDGKLSVDGLSSAGGATGFSVTRQTADNGATKKEYDGKTLYFMPFGPAGNILSAAVTELQNETTTNSGWKGATTASLTVYLGDANLDNIVKAPAMTQETPAVIMDAGFEITWVAVYFEGTTEKGTGFDMYLQIAVQALTVSGGNVRNFSFGGLYLTQLDMAKAKSDAGRDLGDGWKQYGLAMNIIGLDSAESYKGFCSHIKMAVDASGKYEHFYIENNTVWITTQIKTLEMLEGFLKANKVILWAVPKNLEDATGMYALVQVKTGGYAAQLLKINGEFRAGDTVVTRTMSGCDKKAVLDGTLDWKGHPTYSVASNKSFAVYLDAAKMAEMGIPKYAFGYSERFKWSNSYYSAAAPAVYAENVFAVRISEEDLAPYGYDGTYETGTAACKAYLNDNPLPVWWKSVEYTVRNDKPVSLEVRTQKRITFNGTENFSLNVGYAENQFLWHAALTNYVSRSQLCNMYKPFSGGWAGQTNKSIQLVDQAIGVRDSAFSTVEEFKQNLASLYAAGTPMDMVYDLSTPEAYAHEPVDFTANPGEDGAWVIIGQTNGKVSAVFNKSLTHTIAELQAAMVSMGAQLSM